MRAILTLARHFAHHYIKGNSTFQLGRPSLLQIPRCSAALILAVVLNTQVVWSFRTAELMRDQMTCVPGPSDYGWKLQIVKRRQRAFNIAGLTWIVERSFAWLGRNRRLSKDYEYAVQTSETMIDMAAIRIMLNQLAQA
jgi:hypothetical protein